MDRGGKSTFVNYKHDPSIPWSLSDNTILSIYEDQSRLLWVGTFSGGLNQSSRAKEHFTHYQHDPNNLESLGDNRVFSIYEDPRETRKIFWLGTQGGLCRMNLEGKETFVNYKHDPNDPRSIIDNRIRSVYQDRLGVLWIGTYGGLSRMNGHELNRAAFTHYQHDPNDDSSLSHNRVWSIHESPNEAGKVLWIGTFDGLNRFDRATKTFMHYKHDPNNPRSLSDNYIRTIYEDRSGVLWLGTLGGLNRFDRATKTFTHYKHDPNNPGSLSDNRVRSIHEDSNHGGMLWIGTSGGLNQFDRTTGIFKPYREKDGLPNDTVYGILEDDRGYLWLSTNEGLAKFNPENETFRNYDVNDGLQSNEFNGGAYFKSRNGEFFFGGASGLNVFHPDSLKDNPHIPPIVITDFKIFNKALRPGMARRFGKPLQSHITETEEIVLSYKENVFSFEFAALDFTFPQKNNYAYKMENFDEDWIYSETRRFAMYTNLDPGEYVFRVKGSNNDGLWNEKGAAIKITITPPFWQTWWFRIVAGASVLALAFGWYRSRIKNIETQKKKLEIQVEEKTREIRQTQAQLVQSEKMAALGKLTAGIAHEINTPLGALISNGDLFMRSVRKVKAIFSAPDKAVEVEGHPELTRLLENIEQLNTINKTATDRIMAVVNSLRNFARLDMAELAIVDIHQGLENTLTLAHHELKNCIEIHKDYGNIPPIKCYPNKLNQVFMNLFVNASHAIHGQGEIFIKTRVRDGTIMIEFKDTGIGIADEDLGRIFDPGFTKKGFGVGTGLGLSIVYQIIEDHKGKIEVESEIGKGTVFRLILPLNLEKSVGKKSSSS